MRWMRKRRLPVVSNASVYLHSKKGGAWVAWSSLEGWGWVGMEKSSRPTPTGWQKYIFLTSLFGTKLDGLWLKKGKDSRMWPGSSLSFKAETEPKDDGAELLIPSPKWIESGLTYMQGVFVLFCLTVAELELGQGRGLKMGCGGRIRA